MMKRLGYYIPLLLLAVSLSACSLFIQEPHVTLKETRLAGISSSGLDVEFVIGVTNPNSFDLALLGYTYDLQVMALPTATGGAQNPVTFSAGKDTDMLLPVHLKFSSLLEIIKRQPNLEKLPYHLKATLHVSSPLGTKLIPVEKNDTLPVPENYRPEIIMDRLRNVLQSIL